MKQGANGDMRNLLFALYADGFQPSNTGYSSTALYLSCLNMSCTARSNTDNIALFCFIPGGNRDVDGGQKCYDMNVYLEPLIASLTLTAKGVQMPWAGLDTSSQAYRDLSKLLSDNDMVLDNRMVAGRPFLFRAALACLQGDQPALADLGGRTQCTGKGGCGYCSHSALRSAAKKHQYWPVYMQDFQRRPLEALRDAAIRAGALQQRISDYIAEWITLERTFDISADRIRKETARDKKKYDKAAAKAPAPGFYYEEVDEDEEKGIYFSD